ncbi:hypothetical protein G6F57_003406 [Rhizopus arrhizus]|uniref:Uncharacterized protein n=1 Tax=Rhizopus oryzae TaxID=64495 RepID=A0A9P6XCX1_RHIOR|nr:hypothetical protein G6F23_004650 [Rhizopus arrhizus]KAG1422901.1 hypothetical protein G6F58_003056 [Rhizopus delemar]KAG0766893.1 hypothetical protein G6F24_003240 [Rhizopus arrhizus]KAG0793726.1 hypothetical protein G6F21_003401 [Rhizopus arrhizus]KAG0800386.1 hypothetical protein G6F22_002280 [Rhizopus arrhizus]
MGNYKCCCCVPVRAGVLFIALLSAAFYVAVTVGLCLMIPKFDEVGGMYITPAMRGVHYASIAVTVIFAFCALFGIVGSITQHRKMISAFKLAYWTSSLIVLVISIAVIVVLAVQRTDIISRCATLNADETIDSCSVHYRNLMIILCCLIVVINLFQFYFAAAISSYATRLRRTNIHAKLRNLEDYPEPPSKAEFF